MAECLGNGSTDSKTEPAQFLHAEWKAAIDREIEIGAVGRDPLPATTTAPGCLVFGKTEHVIPDLAETFSEMAAGRRQAGVHLDVRPEGGSIADLPGDPVGIQQFERHGKTVTLAPHGVDLETRVMADLSHAFPDSGAAHTQHACQTLPGVEAAIGQ